MAGTCKCDNEPSSTVKCREFLPRCEPVSFSRRTLLHGISITLDFTVYFQPVVFFKISFILPGDLEFSQRLCIDFMLRFRVLPIQMAALRRGSAAAPFLGLRVRIQPEA